MTWDSEEQLFLFLEQFREGTLAREEWTHAAHLVVAAYHLFESDEAEATDRIRAGILSLNRSLGIANTPDSGYHETLTRFWAAVVRAQLASEPAGTRALAAIRNVVEAFGRRRDLFKDYYSFDVVRSREARKRWIAPDLRPLDPSDPRQLSDGALVDDVAGVER